jgi:hypothetical protein
MSLLADCGGATSDDTAHPMLAYSREGHTQHEVARARTRGTRVQPDQHRVVRAPRHRRAHGAAIPAP